MKKHTQFVVAVAVIVVLATTVLGVSTMVPMLPSESPRGQLSSISPVKGLYLEQFREMNPKQTIDRIWLDICAMNRSRYPDSNKVRPGDTIQLPLGQYYVAQQGGTDHMWRAALWFTDALVMPYLRFGAPDTTRPVAVEVQGPTTPKASSGISPWWLLILIPVFMCAVLIDNHIKRAKKFVVNPPGFRTASDSAVQATAQTALRSAFGPAIQIVGNVERGVINGTQVMFNADGTSQTETFHNEPGYRARVRFPNDQERLVVCRWACFNPVYNRTGSEFNGTFQVAGSNTTESLPRMSDEQVASVQRSIREADRSVAASDLPVVPMPASAETAAVLPPEAPKETVRPAAVSSPERSATIGPDGLLHFKSIQISQGRFTAEGDVAITFEQLSELVEQFTDRKP